ncbi:autophagy substrate NBR1 [Trifolium medium]|uniref:Autophagy substrate NBR1 n=1 Tax=Trifolium medium TaxID=97028 RepID=A0A392M0U9_9FABA|nr:autophagy substrate NBR1 [Trifolium medium]
MSRVEHGVQHPCPELSKWASPNGPVRQVQVKYGNTLRRFNVPVDESNKMDLNMVGLKAKIRSIFNFSGSANFNLKYVDEEGDLVNLVDDADLHDMMSQQLQFLRIQLFFRVNLPNDEPVDNVYNLFHNFGLAVSLLSLGGLGCGV